MSNDPKVRVGALDQFQIALYASKDKRLSASDLACLFEVVDRFLKDKGITRPTGKAHLERETGRSNGSVKESVRRLLEWEYISVSKRGVGTRGTEYLPNFEWAHRVAAAIKDEVKGRAATKTKRRSGAESCPTSAHSLVGRNSAPLRSLVGQPTAPLDMLVGQNSALQTYVSPTRGDYVGISSAPGTGAGLAAAPARASDLQVLIVDTEIEDENDERWLTLTLKPDSGAIEKFGICVESHDPDVQSRGQRRLERLMGAVGLRTLTEGQELHGLRFTLTAHDDFEPAMAA